jgi:hypothetical protein
VSRIGFFPFTAQLPSATLRIVMQRVDNATNGLQPKEANMKVFRKFSAALAVSGTIAAVMMIGTARVEAKGKKGGDPHDAICQYLASVINYPYVTPIVKEYALALFTSYECDPTLLQ